MKRTKALGGSVLARELPGVKGVFTGLKNLAAGKEIKTHRLNATMEASPIWV